MRPRKLVHHNQHPIAFQSRRLTTEQITAPQAILLWPRNVSQEGPPRIRFRPVMKPGDGEPHPCRFRRRKPTQSAERCGDSPNQDCDVSCPRRRQSAPSSGPWDRDDARARRKQYAILSLLQHPVEMQQRGRLQNNGGAQAACPTNEESAQTGDDPIPAMQVRRAFRPRFRIRS